MYHLIIIITYMHTLFHTLWGKRSRLFLFNSWGFVVPPPDCLLPPGTEVPYDKSYALSSSPAQPPLLLIPILKGALEWLFPIPVPKDCRLQKISPFWLNCFRERRSDYGIIFTRLSQGDQRDKALSGLLVQDRKRYKGRWQTLGGQESQRGEMWFHQKIIVAKTLWLHIQIFKWMQIRYQFAIVWKYSDAFLKVNTHICYIICNSSFLNWKSAEHICTSSSMK